MTAVIVSATAGSPSSTCSKPGRHPGNRRGWHRIRPCLGGLRTAAGCGTQQRLMLHADRRDPVDKPVPPFSSGLVSGQRLPGTRAHSDGLAGCPGFTVTARWLLTTASHLIAPMQARACDRPWRAPSFRMLRGQLRSGPPLGQIKDQSPCHAVRGRLLARCSSLRRAPGGGLDAAQSRLADLARSGAPSTSSVDCYGAGMMVRVRLGPPESATPPPDRAGSGPEGASRHSGGGSRSSPGAKGKARVTFTVDPRVGVGRGGAREWNDWSADVALCAATPRRIQRDGRPGRGTGLPGSGISSMASGGIATGLPTPTSVTTSAETTQSWT